MGSGMGSSMDSEDFSSMDSRASSSQDYRPSDAAFWRAESGQSTRSGATNVSIGSMREAHDGGFVSVSGILRRCYVVERCQPWTLAAPRN